MKTFNRKLKILIPVALLLSVSLFYCKTSGRAKSVNTVSLKLIASYKLNIQEPSGITFNKDHTGYWIVDGNSQVIFKTDLKGNILEKLSYKGNDLEGIYFDQTDSSLWITEERSREVVHIDLKGNEIARFKVNIQGKKNKGFEGIFFNEKHTAFIVNEKKPTALLKLNHDFTILKQYDMDFASDLSDLYYDGKDFFILSDESEAIFVWNHKEGLKKKLLLPFPKAEGIVVDHQRNMIIIVNDATNTLYEFEYK
ncbi:MAG: SdiA-regulated domain-containing protein [Bacteroidota bacterium]|nr:SdiA-regulated domain-containing protein [Bacteroidota bacterium]MDP4190334.1 SdiA-regulated domain-containing protein [Bacteroidota bacterium]MDP4193538.1 SdiA-regulated domain-containing protein [Bacteroidota bacterium]